MCGRFLLSVDIEELLERYRAAKGWSVPGDGGEDHILGQQQTFLTGAPLEIFPSNRVPVVTLTTDRRITPVKWGFVSPYAKGLIINARGETVDSKSLFREAFARRRCIVPASAFFEWKRKDGSSTKYRISHKTQEIFSMAGIYGDFFDKEGKPFTAFSIITIRPNRMIASIHDRMPVIMPREAEDTWLDPGSDHHRLKTLLVPFDEAEEQLEMNLA